MQITEMDNAVDVQGIFGINNVFGKWFYDPNHISELHNHFENGNPFPHCVIPNFFNEEFASQIESKFPVPDQSCTSNWRDKGWHLYNNPIEGKFLHNNIPVQSSHDSSFGTLWQALQSSALVDALRSITGISNLVTDPHLYGAGLHYHPPEGRLEMHLDYSIHPVTKMERRVNLIIYMNRDWEESWGGEIELWNGTNDGPTIPGTQILPKLNCAVLFRTSDVSWHGMPRLLKCPPERGRKSVAVYYMSEPRENVIHRAKATFRPRPGSDEDKPEYLNLCKIRDTRLLQEEDVAKNMPEWKQTLKICN